VWDGKGIFYRNCLSRVNMMRYDPDQQTISHRDNLKFSELNPVSFQAFQEWFGTYRLESRYLNLSDGGHFDNIGVYELLRRRCKYIIVGDAEADTGMKFEAMAISCAWPG
jgi:hypothetical protein